MMTTKGLYLLPKGKDKFTLFYCNGKTKEKLYSSSYGQEIVDMADIVYSEQSGRTFDQEDRHHTRSAA